MMAVASNDSYRKKKSDYTDPVFLSGLIICIAAITLPLFSSSIYPFVDYPVHLSFFQILQHADTAETGFASRFTTHWFTPYSGVYLLAKTLSPFSDAEGVGRNILILYFVLTSITFSMLLKAARQNLRYTFIIFPVLYNFNLSWGFIPFLLAVPLLFLLLSVAVDAAMKKHLSYHELVMPIVAVSLFFTHLFAFMVAVILVSIVILIGAGSWIRRFRNIAVTFVPAGLLGLNWFFNLTYTKADQIFLVKKLQFPSVVMKMKFFPDFVISGDPNYGYRTIFGCLILFLVVYYFIPKKKKSNITPQTAKILLRIRWAIPLSAFIMYLACPYSLLTAVWLFNRLAFLVFAFLVLILPSQLTYKRTFIDIPVIILVIVFSIYTCRMFDYFKEEASGCFECIEQIEPGSSVRGFMMDGKSRYTDQTAYEHFTQYCQLYRKNIVHNPFAVLTHMPIRYRQQFMEDASGFDSKIHLSGTSANVDVWFENYDYFLFRLPHESGMNPVSNIFGIHILDIHRVATNGRWVLFQRDIDSEVNEQ